MKNDSPLTMGIVSAMGVATKGEPKVTDCLINATDMAANRDDSYVEELTKLEDKHVSTAKALLTDKAEYDAYIETFLSELNDLRSMFKAIHIAGCSTDAFGDFVVGHGELWTARLSRLPIDARVERRSGSTLETFSSSPRPKTVALTSTTTYPTPTWTNGTMKTCKREPSSW